VYTTDLGYEQINAGEQLSAEYINQRELTAADIEEYRIKGMWYFDKRQGELKYRMLGIAPVAPDVNFIDDDSMDPADAKVELFWVWLPSARQILHDAKVFNQRNSAQPISFDMLLNARRFNGSRYKEDNVHGDRVIQDYIADNALFQLLESRRIKEAIRDREQDMWAY
jgi:gliding motility associated protien GldN